MSAMSKRPSPPLANRFEMRLSDEFAAAMDEWRRGQVDLPSRAEAIRRLAVRGLDADAEVVRLRARLAAAGVDPDGDDGGTR